MMQSWMIISDNPDSDLSHGASNFLQQVDGREGAEGSRPPDAQFGVDGAGSPCLLLNDPDGWQALYNRVHKETARNRPYFAFTSAPAALLERWFAGRSEEQGEPRSNPLYFTHAALTLRVERPAPWTKTTYREFGPFWRHFLLWRTDQTPPGGACTVEFIETDPDPDGAREEGEDLGGRPGTRPAGNIFWNPREIKGERAAWWSYLAERRFLGLDTAALLPPWQVEEEPESFFSWEPLCVRRAMRLTSGWAAPQEDEPLAITLWRLIDDYALREILRRGGDVRVTGLPPQNQGGASLVVRLPVPPERKRDGRTFTDHVDAYRNEFFLAAEGGPGAWVLSTVGREVAEATRGDLVLAAGPAPLRVRWSEGGEPNRPWPFDDVDAGPQTMEQDDPLLGGFIPYYRERLQDAIWGYFQDRLPPVPFQNDYNLVLNSVIRHFWQPPSEQCDPKHDRSFWRNTLLVADGLLRNELSGGKLAPSRRLECCSLAPIQQTVWEKDHWLVTLAAAGRAGAETPPEVLRAALLMPARTVIRMHRTLILDSPASRLDVSLLG